MKQEAFHMVLHPGMAARYVELHSPVPQEISDQLQKAGIYDFSIFIDGDDVFGVLKYKDESLLRQYLTEDVSPHWTTEVLKIALRRETDRELPLLRRLDRVFRFEGTN